MQNVVDEQKLKEIKDFSETFEKLSEKDKSYVLGYMTCMANSNENKNVKTK